MGGYGSGRYGGRSTADASLRIDLAWMMRNEKVKEGCHIWGTLHWSCGGEPSGSIGYISRMDEPGMERLELSYARGSGSDREEVRQTIRLCFTKPNYGGKRWWLICPYRHVRCGKLYLPNGGDRFASRKAWRLAYQSQRSARRDRPFDRLFRLQKKLGGMQGWEQGLAPRPRGMWHRTYESMWKQYFELDADCSASMMGWLARLRGL